MTDKRHLDELAAATSKPLSRKLVDTFKDAVRDPNVSRADYAQQLKNEMEAALLRDDKNAATQSDSP